MSQFILQFLNKWCFAELWFCKTWKITGFVLFRCCTKLADSAVLAKQATLQYCDKVYSDALCWNDDAQHTVVFMVNVKTCINESKHQLLLVMVLIGLD